MPRRQPRFWPSDLAGGDESKEKGQISMGLEQGRSRHLLQQC